MARRSRGPEVPDTLLPVQFFTRSTLANSPEKRLFFAVLMDAVNALQRGDIQGVFDAEHWIRDETEDVTLRFTDVCEALGIEPQGLAAALMSLSVRPMRVPPSRRRVTPFGMLASKGAQDAPSAGRTVGRP